MALFNPSRNEVRQFFFDTWAKFKQEQKLTGLETIAVEVMQMHPEYHAILEMSERHLEQAYFPEMGETNPFLHMSLHLSALEQISIDQPTGIGQAYKALLAQGKTAPDAQHDLMDCLAEAIWQAQREGRQLDAAAYLECMRKKAS